MGGESPHPSIEFIHRTIGLDSKIILAYALSAKQPSASVVPGSCVNAHAASYDRPTLMPASKVYLCAVVWTGQRTDMGNTNTSAKQKRYDDAYMRMAHEWAQLSHCQRKQVGALIVKDQMIIADGYNGAPSGFPNACENEEGETHWYVLHAEANAITKLAKSNNSAQGATLYITLSPCRECAKLIHQAGIVRVVYRDAYKDDSGLDFLKQAGVEIAHV